MQCPQCQAENPPGTRFCGQCAAQLAVVCSSCGATNPPQNRFCGQCATPLGEQAESRLQSPQAYTPRHLADKILSFRSALEGERKHVTVLFVDIVDSSRLAERLDSEVMHEVMDRVLRLMAAAVHRYEGTVNQFLGDGLMALFGAPVALEDHAVRAVQAALTIQETVKGYSEQLARERGLELRLRQGLNSGLVVVGKIGDDLRMDYTAVGETTHLAARMQTLAEAGAILVTAATHNLVSAHVSSESLGSVSVKGLSQPVSVFKITGRRRRRSRLEVQAEAGLTTLIGRDRELGILQTCFGRVRAGRGQVVGIVGEPGAGKSRLIHEFRQRLGPEPVTWLEGHCLAHALPTPYLPLVEQLRANFQMEDGDNPLQLDEKLRRGLHRVDPDLERFRPFLGELLGLQTGDEVLRNLEPRHKRQQTFDAVRALTLAGSRQRPIVLVFEDLHWIDKTTEEYLVFLLNSVAAAPILVLSAHRPGYTVRWTGMTSYTQLALDLLTDGEVETMVTRILDVPSIPADLMRVVQAKAEGNPLFVEEITASLRERGLLSHTDEAVVMARHATVEIPGTIQDIIRARLDRLDERVKRTAQTAAVIGREFGLSLLARVAEVARDAQRHVDVLRGVEIVHETSVLPEPHYAFKHAAIQDVAYQSLLAQRRRSLHGAIGRALEELAPGRLEEQSAILAYHYARSDRPGHAIRYAIAAGDRAGRLYANAEARGHYEQALSIAHALPGSAESRRWQIDASVKLASVSVGRQDVERDLLNLKAARALAEQVQDRRRLAEVLYWLGRTLYVLGDTQAALQHGTESLEIADAAGDEALAAPPVNLIGRIYLVSDFAKASEMMARSAEQMHRLGNKIEESTAAGFAGHVFGYMGDFPRALTHADRGIAVAREIHNPFAEAAGLLYRGVVHVQRGDWPQAIADLDAAAALSDRAGDLFRVYVIKFWLGRAHTMAGDPRRGHTVLQESLALANTLGTTLFLTMPKAFLAETLVALGEPDTVPALCEEAIELAAKVGDKQGNALAHRGLAMALVALDLPDLERADHAVREAIRMQEELGARPELGRSHVAHARVCAARGQRDRATDALVSAVAIFRTLGMRWDLRRAEACRVS